MKEIKDIIKAYEVAAAEGKQAALATVVHLQGSAYRRPGARMLVTIDGKLTGAISGGCLEGDALRKAQLVMVQNKPMLVTYDTTDDDDTTLGVGLGCNGIISILIEPIDPENKNNPIAFLQNYLDKRQEAVIVTLFSLNKKVVQPGTCLMLTHEGQKLSNTLSPALNAVLIEDATNALSKRKAAINLYDEQTGLNGFVEYLPKPVALLLVGAGNDCMPVAEMGLLLGWEVTVLDGRANYATKERFPRVTNRFVSKAEEALQVLTIDERTVALLMTHNYNYDLAILRQLIHHPTPYIGVLGPKKKMDRMLQELEEEGQQLTSEQLAIIYGPSGFDVGSETAEEIALSMIAEIQAVLNSRSGHSLRGKNTSIHDSAVTKS